MKMSGQSMKESMLQILQMQGISQEELETTKNVKEFQQLLKRKKIEKELHQMGFNSLEELQKALKDYKEKNLPELAIPEDEIDLKCLDEITDINFDDINIDIDFSFLDKKEEEK